MPDVSRYNGRIGRQSDGLGHQIQARLQPTLSESRRNKNESNKHIISHL